MTAGVQRSLEKKQRPARLAWIAASQKQANEIAEATRWQRIRSMLKRMGVVFTPKDMTWDSNGGNSVFMRGRFAGYSVNAYAMAYAKRFGLTPKPTSESFG